MYRDGWLLQRKEVEGLIDNPKPIKNTLPGRLENCKECVYLENLGVMYYCQYPKPGCHFFPRNVEKKEPEPKPVKVKAWVRWVTLVKDQRNVGVARFPTERDDKEIKIDEKWHSILGLIAEGCEHTDTPDIEESWTKIGENQ
jgi:hypothetical protein